MSQQGTDHSTIKANNITWHEGHVTREERAKLLKQGGATLWFTLPVRAPSEASVSAS